MNKSYKDMKAKYCIPRSTTKIHQRKNCHPLECRNTRKFQKMMKKGEVPKSKLIEVLQISVKNHKLGIPTYLSLYEEKLLVEASEI